ncbi:MAG TPA: GNAT family N-acetyltransferase [Pirellulales bacterium]|nr:GNAT family N-acetyltransferase [Pirellulales bacterium]
MSDETIQMRPMSKEDIPAVCKILTSTSLCEGKGLAERLSPLGEGGASLSLVAERSGELVGVVLAVYNGFHVFLSHLAVVPGLQRQGVARHLHDELMQTAKRLGALGVITDSRLTTTGFFYQLGYRTPGAVFLVHQF